MVCRRLRQPCVTVHGRSLESAKLSDRSLHNSSLQVYHAAACRRGCCCRHSSGGLPKEGAGVVLGGDVLFIDSYRFIGEEGSLVLQLMLLLQNPGTDGWVRFLWYIDCSHHPAVHRQNPLS